MSLRRGTEEHSLAWEALYTRTVEMAREDARAGRDPQVMLGEFAAFTDDYETAYIAALLETHQGDN